MTPSFVAERFERVMGCTSADLISRLPSAIPSAIVSIDAAQSGCTATLPEGSLRLTWSVLSPLRIALLEIPRLSVSFAYAGPSIEQRFKVQKRFDLEMQRGGG